MGIYHKRITYFNDKGYVLGRKATDWLNYKLNTGDPPEGDDLKETLLQGYEWLKMSVTDQEDNIELHVYGLFMQTNRSLFLLGELTEETVVKNYNTCINKINSILNDSEDEEITRQAREIKNQIDDIYGSSGAADCASLINIFYQQLDDRSSDVEFIKNMLRLLRKANCDENELFTTASEKLYELEPSAEAAFNMARRFVKNNETDRAKNYYQEAMKQENNNDLLANYYYEYAMFIFIREDALQEARSYARKALELNPDFCQALMIIGDIYVSASRNYGRDDFEKATVFWLAVDYFELARRTGYDCQVEAAEKVSACIKYFPDKEEIFFRSLQVGQSYKLEGWINESTMVRIKSD
jgi:tetratricopeptide (TPR) repeat protein